MSLRSKKEVKASTPASEKVVEKTVIIQPVSPEVKSNKEEKKNDWGGYYINGKQFAIGLVAQIPNFCSSFSAGLDIGNAIVKCSKKDGTTKKEKAKLMVKTLGSSAVKMTAGVIATRCTDYVLRNLIDTSKKD